jgi:uncharacterized protein (DUF1778 family)
MAQPRTVDPTGKSIGQVIAVRLTPEQRQQLEQAATERGLSMSELLRYALQRELERAA